MAWKSESTMAGPRRVLLWARTGLLFSVRWNFLGSNSPKFRSFSNLSWSKPRTCKGYSDGLMGIEIQEFTYQSPVILLSLGMSCLEGGATEVKEEIFIMLQPVLFTTAKPTNPTQKNQSVWDPVGFSSCLLTTEKTQWCWWEDFNVLPSFSCRTSCKF